MAIIQIAIPTDVGKMLARLRADAEKSQADIAKDMGIDPSRVSRMESGGITPTHEDVTAYLRALETENADQYAQYLIEEWIEIEKSPFDLPERDALHMAERSLRTLRTLLDDPKMPTLLKGQADFYREELKRHVLYLMSRSHRVAYIGDIGVGKTTLLCSQVGLCLRDLDRRTGLPRIVLETGAGGTTVCDVHLRCGPTFAVSIEPENDSAVYRLVGEFCTGIWNEVHAPTPISGEESQDKGVSRETGRALRNLADLPSSRKKSADGKTTRVDPARDLAHTFDKFDNFQADVCERLHLWTRTRREEICELSEPEAGLAWLKEIFQKINNGRHPEFSLPHRIDITVPFAPLEVNGLEIELIDTKGVDGTAIRPDIQAHVDDERTLTVLCSRFNSAPDQSIQGLVEHLIKTGAKRVLGERTLLIVLPRSGEAMEMKDDAGNQADNADEGYELKRDQIESLLTRFGLQTSAIEFTNVMEPDEAKVSIKAIESGIRRLRKERADAISKIEETIGRMRTNIDHENALIAQRTANERLDRFTARYEELPAPNRPVYDVLLKALPNTHHASIWATTRRAGTWYNFDVYHYLGSGAAEDALSRAKGPLGELRGIIRDMRDDTKMEPVHGFLDRLNEHIDRLESRFFNAVRHAGEHIFRPTLENDEKLWTECENLYGHGLNYREEVATKLKNWFVSAKREHLHEAYDIRMKKKWSLEIIEPLRAVYRDQPNPTVIA